MMDDDLLTRLEDPRDWEAWLTFYARLSDRTDLAVIAAWGAALLTRAPDEYADPEDAPSTPSRALPGTPARITAYRRRWKSGERLYHADDARLPL